MANKPITYTDIDRAIVSALKANPSGLTLTQLNEVTGMRIVAGHITSAKNKGLIERSGEVVVERPSTRKVTTYSFVTADAGMRPDGEPYEYTDNEKAILAVAANFNSPFTLADLAEAMGVAKVNPGSISSLVAKKGNIARVGEVEIATVSKSKVGVYSFVRDIPDAE